MKNAEVRMFFQKLKNGYSFSRLGTTFQTSDNYYFYDAGTGKVLQCSEAAYTVLKYLETNDDITFKAIDLSEDELYKAVEEIEDAVKQEKILLAPIATTFIGDATESLYNSISNLNQMCLEVTERCNLRCDYCIYHKENHKFRNYGERDMSWEIAQKAIDYYLAHADPNRSFFAFYGGEPLLKFDLIRKCIEYIQCKNVYNHKISYSMTTNGTLMTPEKAAFFASIPEFNIVFSIDGDQLTHDEQRKDINGIGSFADAFAGYKCTLDAYGERASELISINSVLTPPYTEDKLNRIQDFFNREASGIEKQYSYVEYEREDYENQLEDYKNRDSHSWHPVFDWQTKAGQSQKELFTWGATVKALAIIHKRYITKNPTTKYKFNGCCVPGGRKIYVTTEGKYKVCERVGECPEIGTVDTGLNVECIQRKFINEYIEKSLPDCKKCWAINLCAQCYATCYDHLGINIPKKRVRCEEQRFGLKSDLTLYHQILEKAPDSLLFLNNHHF